MAPRSEGVGQVPYPIESQRTRIDMFTSHRLDVSSTPDYKVPRHSVLNFPCELELHWLLCTSGM